ncbi:hypothetical protein LDENG_00013520 [Lucifuga dentata]|nr:hypothetical protein LDENG_00013520 [Lucifuga dentata]
MGHVVSETLVAFLVKAIVLDPRYGFDVDRKLTEQDVHKLEALCIEKLMEECSPSLDTIKMQVYFDMNYTSHREFIEKIHRSLASRLSSASREITDSRVKTRDEVEAVYCRIVTYILLRSEMGSPTNTSTVQEATAALRSVFPPAELGAFMSLTRKEKEQQLCELTMIVTGIRLYNKVSKKGEKDIDLQQLTPAALDKALPATIKGIENELKLCQSLAWKYTAVLEKLLDSDVQAAGCQSDVLLKQALYNVRQYEAFLKVILADASLCARHVEILQTELLTQMKLLKEAMQSSKTAILTAKVFPLFKALANLWSGLQDESALLNILDDMLTNLQPFLTSQSKIFPEVVLDGLLEGSEVKTDEQRMEKSSDEQIDPAEMSTHEWLFPETTTNFDGLPLQYNGMCGYTLVNKDGLLLPGNPHIGVLKHKEKLYVFSSKEAALKFASSADEFVTEVAEKAKRSAELIQLLKLHQQSEMQSVECLMVNPVTKCDSCMQTEIHPVETNINKSYEWNEWELRRKAIKLANLRTKATHSVQTNLSHMRRENATQVFLPKDAASQSKRDGESNVPKPQVYLAGLRGQKDGPVIKTNLTRSVDE